MSLDDVVSGEQQLALNGAVLIIDDEYPDVQVLIEYLQEHNIPYTYVSTLEEGIADIIKEAESGKAYSAIVLDNHFRELFAPEGYNGNFNGIDLAEVLTLPPTSDEELLLKTGEELFGELYPAIRDAYENKIILFSGSAESDREHRPDLFYGVIPVTKRPDGFGTCCEVEVLEALRDLGLGLPVGEGEEYELYAQKGQNGCHGW